METDALNNIIRQTFTVLEPKEKNIQDITEDDFGRLDPDVQLAIFCQLKKVTVELVQVNEKLVQALEEVKLADLVQGTQELEAVPVHKRSSTTNTNVGDLPIAVGEEVSIAVLGFNNSKNRMNISLKSKDYLVRVPANSSWGDVGIKIGDSFKVTVAEVESKSAPFRLMFLECLQHDSKNNLQDNLQKEPEIATEVFKNITMNKKTQTHNKWTPELHAELKRVALTGKHIDDIFAKSQKHGLPFTKYALMAQLNVLGFSSKNGIFTLRSTVKEYIGESHE